MHAGGSAGVAQVADGLSLLHPAAGSHGHAGHMGIQGGHVTVIDHHIVAVGPVAGGRDHSAGGGRHNDVAGVVEAVNIDAVVGGGLAAG